MKKLILSILTLVICIPAFADTIRVEFAGFIRTSTFYGPDPFTGAIGVGDRFSGVYVYDGAALPVSGPPLPGQANASYISDGIPYGMTLEVNGISGSSVLPTSRLYYRVAADQSPRDAIDIQTTDFVMGGVPAYLAQIFLGDSTQMAVNSLDLPQEAPDLDDFDIRNFFLGFGPASSPDAVFIGTIDTIETLAEPTTVEIDIKPGKTPNSINPTSGQKIPVAILTTDAFDASQVDLETVLFGPGGATKFHAMSHIKDVDKDGDLDLLLRFDTQDTGIVCGQTEATLTGELFSGEPIAGTDSIYTTPCR